MTPAIILPADQWSVLDSGWLWLRAERVKEWEYPPASGEWHGLVDGSDFDPTTCRERLVPPSIPEGLEPTPCGMCEHGWVQGHEGEVLPCQDCGGSGVVAKGFYVGTEQWRILGNEPWTIRTPAHQLDNFTERRPAYLALARFTGPPIPVVDQDHPVAGLHFDDGRQHLLALVEEDTLWDITDLPWAQGLQVGDVLVPVAVDMLDTPITDMPGRCDCFEKMRTRECDHGRVPLSLVPGTWGTVQ